MKTKTVILGLSGGVDSSVAALLLKKQGYKVISVFMRNFSDTKSLQGECTWKEERRIAMQIALLLKIPFITLNFEKEYRRLVIDPMFKSYARGKTPNPDILCNRIIKFPLLWKAAKKYKADFIATGHYARIKKTSKGFQLLQGKDKEKDQSYFLAELSQQDLCHTLFPLGNLTKNQVRKIAKKNNFLNWNKQGSRGICFVGQLDFQKFLKKKIKEKPSPVKDHEGNIIGTHKGISFYTIGQKVTPSIGINIDKSKDLAQKRFYIADKTKSNTLVVAPEGHPSLYKKEIKIKNLHFINPNEPIPESGLKARIRHRGYLHAGRLIKLSKNFVFIFKKPVEALAEGQYLVVYKGSYVLGSGEITDPS